MYGVVPLRLMLLPQNMFETEFTTEKHILLKSLVVKGCIYTVGVEDWELVMYKCSMYKLLPSE